ncbi:conserved hypothetical protein [Ricinus communis]|uniref:Uncharacterized protein n=1 Tax=Ricinus communis TaxID=3988 RepID=B9STT7_RICCO|nr:conserved hypothetical protein [Ricinus communis]
MTKLVVWSPRSDHWIKLNTDGCAKVLVKQMEGVFCRIGTVMDLWLTLRDARVGRCSSLVQLCRSLIKNFHGLRIQHVYYGGNRSPSSGVVQLLHEDASSISFSSLVSG